MGSRDEIDQNLDLLVPVFYFVKSVVRSVTADRKRASSGDKIA